MSEKEKRIVEKLKDAIPNISEKKDDSDQKESKKGA